MKQELSNAIGEIADLKLGEDVSMADRTSLRIGGTADLIVIPYTVEALAAAVETVHSHGAAALPVGNGTNMLVLDGGVRDVVIELDEGLNGLDVNGNQVIAGGGVPVAAMCKLCADCGLAGMEWAAGIPGTVGGALNMNAGANGCTIGQRVQWVDVVTADGEIARWDANNLSFGYRTSSFQGSHAIVAAAAFEFENESPRDIRTRMWKTILDRCSKQPVTQCSAGSVFKRPEGDYAGRLLEEAGAKGITVGDARVSTKHANFIINTGNATAEHVLQLVHKVQRMVRKKLEVELEMEVCVIGEALPHQQWTKVPVVSH